jgi:DNA-binding beta-propeller fold protein YncE
MKRLLAILPSALVALVVAAHAQQSAPLRLVQTIPLPNVEGRIDHFGVDPKGSRLFVCALGNDTVEVLDLRAGKQIHTLGGLAEPQGVAYVPEVDRIFVANGRDGTCRIFDGHSYHQIGTVKFPGDADNVRYDAGSKRVYVGYGDGALGIIDAANGVTLGDIKLEAHPESFQLEPAGPRIFVNVPEARHIAVIDRNRRAVLAKWPLTSARANFPLALDGADQRLFVTCRRPAEVIVFDMTSGQVVSSLPVVSDADDMFYDARSRRIYISGGGGFISVIEQLDPDHYRAIAKIRTAPGARTSFFLPELRRLYLAVPHRGGQAAEIRIYEAQP